jgi:cystathionine beta-lyase
LTYDFDRIIDRRSSGSIKWNKYPADVLPLWVADMDFNAPEPILAALQAGVTHGVFGYEMPSKELLGMVAARMEKLYGWQVSPEAVVATPGIVSAFNAAARAICAPGEGILVQPPVYPPFLSVAGNVAAVRQLAPLKQVNQGSRLHYEIDWQAFEEAVNSGGARTGMFLLCAPHNPTGQIYADDELRRMAAVCLKHGIVLCSDEIHSELLLGGARHVPVASLDPAIAAQSLTLVAPSKTFNVPGLFCGFAIIPDKDLCERYKKTVESMTLHVSSLGLAAAQAAFSGDCEDWLAELRLYLTANRDFLVGYVEANFPGIRVTAPDATYLAWLDCNDLIRDGKMAGPAHKFFLEQARVALNDGAEFGPGGEGFVRLNFGCPRQTLTEALERMTVALARMG